MIAQIPTLAQRVRGAALPAIALCLLLTTVGCTGCSDDVEPGGLNVEEPTVDAEHDDASDTTEADDADTGADVDAADAGDAGDDEVENWDICGEIDADPPNGCGPDHPFGSGDCEEGAVVFTPDEGCREVGQSQECDCLDDGDCVAFDTIEECAEQCVAAGWCIEEKMPQTACPGNGCGTGAHACVDGDDEQTVERRLEEHFEDVDNVRCQAEEYMCATDLTQQWGCPEMCCSVDAGTVTESYHHDMCRFTLKGGDYKHIACPSLD